MPAKGLSRRRLEKQLGYAAQGIAIGLIASSALISGTIVIVRWIIGKPVNQKLLFGCALLTMILLGMMYRLWHLKRELRRSRRFPARGVVKELSASDRTDKTKSA